MKNLKGAVAVVTGAGSGIGRATAHALSEHGAAVAVCGHDIAAAKAVTHELGSRASAHAVDVTCEQQMRDLVRAVLAEHRVVDIVVNNAGIMPAPTASHDPDMERFHQVIDVNFWGVVHGSLFFLPHLLERPSANLVNVASHAGLIAGSRMASYNASKFAVRGFTETLRMELRPTSVRATVVCPGSTRTRLLGNSPVIDKSDRQSLQKHFAQTWAVPAEKVANAIVTGIRRDRPRVLIGPDTKALDALVRLMPGAYSRLLASPSERYMKQILGRTH